MPTQSRTFRVFVSSTFADMKTERDALQERVFPRLKELCESHQCRFQAVDLRWGVSEEAALDQQTMSICLNELQRCRDVSPRPNFIILLGDRYGWMPLASQIEAAEFVDVCTQIDDSQARARLDSWYQLDTNAVPPEYVLRARRDDVPEEADYDRWSAIEAALHADLLGAINRLGWPKNDKRRIKYECSATHQEIISGALELPDEREHVFAFLRHAPDPESLPKDSIYIDGGLGKAKALKDVIKNARGVTSFEYPMTWLGPDLTSDIDRFAADALDSLTRVIEEELHDLDEIVPLSLEDIAHEKFGVERCRHFIGRHKILDDIARYLHQEQNAPLVVYGPSGSGKSALIAKAAFESAAKHGDAQVIQRYVGATPDSTDIRTLLLNLCREVTLAYHGDTGSIPTEYTDLKDELPKRLALAVGANPLFVFLDALDQLGASDNAHGLDWLPAALPANVKMVVSVLEREGDAGECLKSAKSKLPGDVLLHLDDMHPEEGEQALKVWLTEAYPGNKRALTSNQFESVLSGFRECPKPLYMKLAFEEARRWKSYDTVPELARDIPGMVEAMLLRLRDKRHHGEVMVSSFLGLLSAARHGLSETEILELLSTDKSVLKDLSTRSARSPETKGIPVVVWLRLYHDLSPYLMERAADETVLFNFYHRLVEETIQKAFLKRSCHADIADYFLRQAIGPRQINELPWQLAAVKSWEHLRFVLQDKYFFTGAWENNRFEVMSYWAQIEGATPMRMVEAYRAQIQRPDSEPDKGFLWKLGDLMRETGHQEESLRIRAALVEHFRAIGEMDTLQACLGNLANVMHACGDLDGAMTLHKEEEQICRRLGNMDGLQHSLGNQALILQTRGDLDQAMAMHKEKAEICRNSGNLNSLAVSLTNQSAILRTRGDLDGTMALLRESERIFRQLGHLNHTQSALHNQAVILYSQGDLDEAMAIYEKCERICRDLGDLDGLQGCLGDQAAILKDRGDLDGAMLLDKEAERICRQTGNLSGLSASLNNQATILRLHGDLDGAASLQKQSENIFHQLGDLKGLSASMTNQAIVLSSRGDMDGSLALHKEAERIFRQLGDLDGLQYSLGNQATVLRMQGDFDAALTLHKEEERICRQLNDPKNLALCLSNRALVLEAQGDLGAAMADYKEAEAAFRLLGNLDGLQNIIGNQADVLEAWGDLDGAMELYKEQELICRHLGNLQSLAGCFCKQGLLLKEGGDPDEALSLFHDSCAILRKLGDTTRLHAVLDLEARMRYARGDFQEALIMHSEQEEICRNSGDIEGLARALASQASVYFQVGRAEEAYPLAVEAQRVAAANGFTAMAGQIAHIVDAARRTIQGL